jgi:hypothetical protein
MESDIEIKLEKEIIEDGKQNQYRGNEQNRD